MAEESLTRRFAEVLCGWAADEPAVLERCRWLLVDGLACAVGGSRERGPSIAAGLTREQRGRPAAQVIGKGFATSEVLAARVNGMAMHVLDYEPMWKPANHVLSTVLPAILAIAESREGAGLPAQGGVLLQALAVGVEAQGRLRVGSGQYDLDKLQFHPPGVAGPLAAAAAAARMLDLDVDQTVAALGIAASRACGILGNVGSMTKALHCGDAASHGLEAALLAARGFTADGDAIAGPRGYARAYFGDSFDPGPLTAPLVRPRALDPGPAWKLFPTQYGTHYAITAALDCRSEIDDPSQISAVTAIVPVMPYVDRPKPRSGLDGKFSFQYGIAAALLDARIDVATYADERRFAPDMETLLDRIRLIQDEAIPRRVDAMHVEVSVTLDDGAVVRRLCDAPIGSWNRPVDRDALDAKARSLLEPIVGPAGTDRLFDLVYGSTGSFAVGELMRCVAGPVHQPA